MGSADLSDFDSVLPNLGDYSLPTTLSALTDPDTSSSVVFDSRQVFLDSPPPSFASASASTSVAALPVANNARITKKVKPVPSNVSHTRRCRAKVNSKLQELLSVLPDAAHAAGAIDPLSGGKDKELDGAKHKAQILAVAISRFHALRSRNSELEMRLAMSSPHHMRRWVRAVVEGATPSATSSADKAVINSTAFANIPSGTSARPLPDVVSALKSFMALICVTRSWKYAELWEPEALPDGDVHLRYRASTLPRALDNEEQGRIRAYRSSSRRFRFVPRSGVPGRVYLTKRPEWLPTLDDAVAFPRAPHAVAQKMAVTFAVPFLVDGEVRMVVEFYDTAKRVYDPAIVNIANEISAMFGSAFEERNPRSCAVVSEVV